MRARHFLALFAAGLTAIAAVGCDGSTDGEGGAGGTGGGDTGGTAGTGGGTGGTTMGTTSSTTSSTPMTDGNDSFEEAVEVDILDPGVQGAFGDGEIFPADTDNDYYKFEGTKGQGIFIFTQAKTAQGVPDPFADGYPDLVVTMFDADKKQIAQNDDPIPRDTQDSSFYTVLPADGTYYLKVEDFCQVLGASAPNCDQAYFDGIEEPSYTLFVVSVDPATDGNVGEPTTDNDTPVEIAATEYVENDEGTGYYALSIQGTFKSATDEDQYTFTVPDAIAITNGRETGFFEVFPTGPNGNGSATPTGKVWITDMNGDVIAEVDGTKLDPIDGYPINAPLTFGQEYTLHVKAGGPAAAGANNFYYVLHYRGGSNPVEAGDIDAANNNDDIPTAELLPTNMSAGGFQGGFVAGDLSTAADVDYFEIEAQPSAGDSVFATCSAQRIGSGLRNLKLTLINADTQQPIPNATSTETLDASASLGDTGASLSGATKVILKVEADQDPVVKGTYYTCGVVFIPPA